METRSKSRVSRKLTTRSSTGGKKSTLNDSKNNSKKKVTKSATKKKSTKAENTTKKKVLVKQEPRKRDLERVFSFEESEDLSQDEKITKKKVLSKKKQTKPAETTRNEVTIGEIRKQLHIAPKTNDDNQTTENKCIQPVPEKKFFKVPIQEQKVHFDYNFLNANRKPVKRINRLAKPKSSKPIKTVKNKKLLENELTSVKANEKQKNVKEKKEEEVVEPKKKGSVKIISNKILNEDDKIPYSSLRKTAILAANPFRQTTVFANRATQEIPAIVISESKKSSPEIIKNFIYSDSPPPTTRFSKYKNIIQSTPDVNSKVGRHIQKNQLLIVNEAINESVQDETSLDNIESNENCKENFVETSPIQTKRSPLQQLNDVKIGQSPTKVLSMKKSSPEVNKIPDEMQMNSFTDCLLNNDELTITNDENLTRDDNVAVSSKKVHDNENQKQVTCTVMPKSAISNPFRETNIFQNNRATKVLQNKISIDNIKNGEMISKENMIERSMKSPVKTKRSPLQPSNDVNILKSPINKIKKSPLQQSNDANILKSPINKTKKSPLQQSNDANILKTPKKQTINISNENDARVCKENIEPSNRLIVQVDIEPSPKVRKTPLKQPNNFVNVKSNKNSQIVDTNLNLITSLGTNSRLDSKTCVGVDVTRSANKVDVISFFDDQQEDKTEENDNFTAFGFSSIDESNTYDNSRSHQQAKKPYKFINPVKTDTKTLSESRKEPHLFDDIDKIVIDDNNCQLENSTSSSPENNLTESYQSSENLSEAHLFDDDINATFFQQPARHTYCRKRPIKNYSYDTEEETADEENGEGDSNDRRLRKRAKKSKKPPKESKELNQWAKKINKTFEEIDKYELCIE